MLSNNSLKKQKLSIRKIPAALALVSVLFSGSWVNVSHAESLNVCYDQWAPMTIFPNNDSPDRGFVIEMLEQIYLSQGYELTYYEVPLARGLNMVTEGLCDMLPEYLFSLTSVNDFTYAAEETFSYTAAFVIRQDDPWRYDGIQSVKGKRIATGPGWDYSSMSVDYQNYIDDPKNAGLIEIVAGDNVVDRIFQMIVGNRVDLYADNELVLQYVLNTLNLNHKLKIVYPGLENKLIEMPIFSNKIPIEKRQKLINIWNEGRFQMKGEKEKVLLNKYQVSFE